MYTKSYKTDYQKKLLDPRWQKKRLEILQRDEFTCQKCGDTKNTLHVHHRRYITGNEPWEYDDFRLITLCATCHEDETETGKDIKEDIYNILCDSGFLPNDIHEIATGVINMELLHLPQVVASAYRFAFSSNEMQKIIIEKYFEYLEEKNGNVF